MVLKRFFGFFLTFTAFFSIQSGFVFAQTATTTNDQNSVDLLVEPQTYIPPFYKGLPLFSNQAVVRIFAFPNITAGGQKIESKDLVFKWTENDTVMGEDSGLGQDSITIDPGLLINNPEISVSVLDSNNNELAGNSITIDVKNPQIFFYENSPLYGILFNNSLNNGYNLGSREELNVVAKPFFFSVSDATSSDLTYSWSVNGSPISLSGPKNSILLRQTTQGQSGATSVSLNLSDQSKDFQSANSEFSVSFGQ